MKKREKFHINPFKSTHDQKCENSNFFIKNFPKLPEPVQFSEKINPICLPFPKKSYENIKASVTGWGYWDGKGKEEQPKTLQWVSGRGFISTICN